MSELDKLYYSALKEAGVDVEILKENEHEIIYKEQPPTLDRYPIGNLNARIICTPKPFGNEKPEIFRQSKGMISNFQDRRPAWTKSKKDFIELQALKKEKAKEKKEASEKEVETTWEEFKSEEKKKEEVEEEGEEESLKEFDLGTDKEKPEERKTYANQMKVQEASRMIQKFMKRMNARKELKLLKKKRTKREHIAKEIYSTEKTYVESLDVAHKVYVENMKRWASEGSFNFKLSDYNAIFTNAYSSMKQYSDHFFKILGERIFDEKTKEYLPFSMISKSFLVVTPFLKTYKDYCSNFGNATAHIRKLKASNSEFKKNMAILDKDERTSRLGLNSYLILPIQRIPRYKLLLTDLLKNTEKEHPDFQLLRQSLKGITDVANYLDRACKDYDEKEKILKLMTHFTNLPSNLGLVEKPNRRMIEKIENMHFTLEGEKEGSNGILYLFNDLLLFAKPLKKESFQFLAEFDLMYFKFFVSPSTFPNSLKIVEHNPKFTENNKKWIIVRFEQEEEKKKFMKKILGLQNKLFQGDKKVQTTLTEFEKTTVGVASVSFINNFFSNLSDSDCLQFMKYNKFRVSMIEGGKKFRERLITVSYEEEYLNLMNLKNGDVEESLRLKGDEISELIVGQKSKVFKKCKIGIEELEGLSFSLRYGNGTMHPEEGWTGETLDLVCVNKIEFLIMTRALTFALMDQAKSIERRNAGPNNDVEGYRLKSNFVSNPVNFVGNDLFTWGKNVSNCLGHSYLDSDQMYPKLVRDFLYLDVIKCIPGEDCIFVILNDGKVFGWGNNIDGKLGHKSTSLSIPSPSLVKKLAKKRIVKVSCGKGHTLFLDEKGFVYSCGSNKYGQLGVSKKKVEKKITEPILVKGIRNAKHIAAGMFFSCAITEDGSCYMWGEGTSGQLGYGGLENQDHPVLINDFFVTENPEEKVKLTSAALGSWHSAFLSSDKNVYVCGSGMDGQLGTGSMGKEVKELSPVMVKTVLMKGRVKCISAGSSFTACVAEPNGKIFVWGQGQFGQIGNGKTENQSSPVALKNFSGCTSISCGQRHILALLENMVTKKKKDDDRDLEQKVIAWGSGNFGRLGLGGKDKDESTPKVISTLEGRTILSLEAGAALSACVTDHCFNNKKKELLKNCFNCGAEKGKRKPCPVCSGVYCSKCLTGKVMFPNTLQSASCCEVCEKIMKNQIKFEIK